MRILFVCCIPVGVCLVALSVFSFSIGAIPAGVAFLVFCVAPAIVAVTTGGELLNLSDRQRIFDRRNQASAIIDATAMVAKIERMEEAEWGGGDWLPSVPVPHGPIGERVRRTVL